MGNVQVHNTSAVGALKVVFPDRDNGPRYYIFAKIPITNVTADAGITVLLSGINSYSRLNTTYLATMNVYRNTPNFQYAKLCGTEQEGIAFGYYSDSEYCYFGIKTAEYVANTTVWLINQATTYRIKTYFGVLADTNAAPDGWTEVPQVASEQPTIDSPEIMDDPAYPAGGVILLSLHTSERRWAA